MAAGSGHRMDDELAQFLRQLRELFLVEGLQVERGVYLVKQREIQVAWLHWSKCRLMAARNKPMRNVTQDISFRPEIRYGLQGLLMQLLGFLSGGFESNHRWEGRFVEPGVRTLRFAQGLRVTGNIQDIVLHLERHTDLLGVSFERSHLLIREAGR